MKQFVNKPDWEYVKVFHASVACGPKCELATLQQDASQKTTAGEELKRENGELEERIKKLKDEYALTYSEVRTH
ncbi:hypothetical protein Mgra_00002216 [Meloidogyne graminicola]|uniref:Uncharacterized protein n=1 Tax=Meloidogyne graminicola TaxID=189291 RepID=A0A8S9ZZD1_9BILA|nr:hypothetical protein Mgra_00002216 [Meloidogyne graminicola]